MGAEIGATCSLFPYDAACRGVPQGDAARGARRPRRPVRRAPAQRPRGRRRPGALLRPCDRRRPLRARAAPRRSAHPGPRPADLGGAGRGRVGGLPGGDLGRARRLVHQLELRGHRPRRARRAPGVGRRAAGQDAAADHARLRAGARDDRARRPARRPRGDRRDRARQRVRSVHRAVAARRHREGRDEHDRLVVQPQLPGPQRRQRGDALVHRLARDGRPRWRSPAGSTSTSCASRSTPDGTEVQLVAPIADELPRKGFDPGESGFVAAVERPGLGRRSW